MREESRPAGDQLLIMTKKRFAIITMIATGIFILTLFLPLYQINVTSGDTAYGYMSWPWVAFLAKEGSLVWGCFVFLGVYVAGLLGTIILHLKSYLADPLDGDKEDKYFVFGSFLGAIASAIYALVAVSITSVIPMIFALVYSILFVVSILIHHKYLAEY